VDSVTEGLVSDADIEAVTCRDFAEADVPTVRALLAAYGVEPHERDPRTIRLALLRLANGDRAALPQWVAWAKLDWRDVLLAVHQTYGTSWVAPFLMNGAS
jgi:hypothetical protein